MHSPEPFCAKGLRYQSALSAMPTTTRWTEPTIGFFKSAAVGSTSPFRTDPWRLNNEAGIKAERFTKSVARVCDRGYESALPLRETSVYAAHAHATGSMPIAPYIVAIDLIP
jgi:hypothetical protein